MNFDDILKSLDLFPAEDSETESAVTDLKFYVEMLSTGKISHDEYEDLVDDRLMLDQIDRLHSDMQTRKRLKQAFELLIQVAKAII